LRASRRACGRASVGAARRRVRVSRRGRDVIARRRREIEIEIATGMGDGRRDTSGVRETVFRLQAMKDATRANERGRAGDAMVGGSPRARARGRRGRELEWDARDA